MSKVTLEAEGTVAVLKLNNGVTNAINLELVGDLTETLRQVKSEFKGMVLTGGDKFFCIGLDLPGLLELSRSEMNEFYGAFCQAVLDLYTMPLPTASAIAGHATAGGGILAISTDFRFIASGRKLFGFNEVKIGLSIPGLADLILRQLVGDRGATEMIFNGEFFEPESANHIGLVDAVCTPEDLEKEAIAKITALAAMPSGGMALAKNNRVEVVRLRYDRIRKADADGFLNCWFNPSVRELLKETAKKF